MADLQVSFPAAPDRFRTPLTGWLRRLVPVGSCPPLRSTGPVEVASTELETGFLRTRHKAMRSRAGWIAFVALMLASTVEGQDEPREVTFSGATWSLRGDVKLDRHLGREALLFRNGAATLEGVDFSNGTIEYEVATGGDRSFVGVGFRMQPSRTDYENFYLRPHQSGRFDAMQYTPVFHRNAAWQLYPEYNRSYDIPRDEWLKVRLRIVDSYMEVYLGESEEPVQVVDDLRLKAPSGGLSLLALFPANEPEGYFPTAYSNVEVRLDDEGAPETPRRSPTGAAEPDEEAHEGLIERWSVSPAFTPADSVIASLPAEESDTLWTEAQTDQLGRLNISEYRAFPEGANGGSVLARVVVRSDVARTVPLDFGFSDRGSVFLNGELVFRGDRSYRSRSLRYLGVMTVDGDTVMLPLEAGDNELTIAVSERFGGWGLIARLPELDGLTISPH